MKDTYHSDDILRGKLQDYSVETPLHLWDKIDQKRSFSYKVKNQLKIHKVKISLALLLLLLLGSWGIYHFTHTTQYPEIAFTPSIQAAASQNLNKGTSVATLANDLQSKKTPLTSSVNEKSVALNEMVTSEKDTKKPAQQSVTSIDKNINVDPLEQKNLIDKNQNTVVEKAPISVLAKSDSSHKKITKVEKTSQKSTSQVFNEVVLNTEQPKKNGFIAPKNVLAQSTPKPFAFTPNSILNRKDFVIPNEQLSLSLDTKTRPFDRGCADFNRKEKARFSVDAFTTLDYNTKFLGTQNNNTLEEPDNYIQQRENTETSRYGWGAGARVSVIFPVNVSLRTGLFYSQIHERFNYEDTMANRTIIVTVIDDATQTESSDTVSQAGTRVMESFNYYRMLDIPLLVGYTMHRGNMKIGINGGVLFNIFMKQKGHILTTTYQPSRINTNGIEEATSYFQETIGFQLYGSLELGYAINDRMDFILEPNIRHMVNSVTQFNHPISQRYTTYGLATGLRFNF